MIEDQFYEIIERNEKRFNELDISIIPWLKDEEGTLISSTRLREKDERK
ncbi:MAG: hypothetical protein IH840_13155 [Candidatus Heimdallarchaeota archaeon]|nr:hypothetical protein [Candidatus Heimdallarchaeota archaeon]